jgi:hypothetical protein
LWSTKPFRAALFQPSEPDADDPPTSGFASGEVDTASKSALLSMSPDSAGRQQKRLTHNTKATSAGVATPKIRAFLRQLVMGRNRTAGCCPQAAV